MENLALIMDMFATIGPPPCKAAMSHSDLCDLGCWPLWWPGPSAAWRMPLHLQSEGILATPKAQSFCSAFDYIYIYSNMISHIYFNMISYHII